VARCGYNRMCDNFSGCTQLAILDLKQAEADSATEELLDSARGNGIDPTELELIGVECDVVSEESVKNAFDQIAKRFGRIDAVVASAGAVVTCITVPPRAHFSKGIVENYPALEYGRRTFPFSTGR